MGNAVFRRHILDHGPRRAGGASRRDEGDDIGDQRSVLRFSGRRQADISPAALGAEGALQEVELSACAGKLPRAGSLGILLSHQIHGHTAVDADIVFQLSDPRRIMDIVQAVRAAQRRMVLKPVKKLRGSGGKVPGHESPVEGFVRSGQLSRLEHCHVGIADGAGMASQIPESGSCDHVRDSEGDTAYTEAQSRAVRDLREHIFRDPDLSLRRRLVALYRKRAVHTLDDQVRLGYMGAVRSFRARNHRIMLVHLKDHRLRCFHNGPEAVVRCAEGAVSVGVRLRHRDHRHVHTVMLPVKERHLAEQHRDKADLTFRLFLSLVGADVPAVPGKSFVLRICLQKFYLRGIDQTAADLHIREFPGTRCQRLVHQLGEACSEAEIDPVTGSHRFRGSLRRHKSAHIFTVHAFPLPALFSASAEAIYAQSDSL